MVLPDLRRAAKLGLIPFHPIGRRRHLSAPVQIRSYLPVRQRFWPVPFGGGE